MVVGLPVTAPLPLPTVSSVLADTEVTLSTTAVRADPVGPFDAPVAEFGLWFSLTTTKTSTTASTTTTLPEASRIRRRCSARRSAARCAAIFSRRVDSTLVLLALPMLAAPNPLSVIPDKALYRRRFAALARVAIRTQSEPSASGEKLLSERPPAGRARGPRAGPGRRGRRAPPRPGSPRR